MRILGFSLLLATGATAAEIEFNRDIRPLLSDTCFQCHGPDSATRKAGLRLDREAGAKAEAIVPGDPDSSELIARIFHDDPDEIMPPPDSNLSLTRNQQLLIRDWIAQGAKWQAHWAFIPPKRSPERGIDHFIENRLAEDGLKLSPEASRETLIRRVTLDLTGLPPTLAEVEHFSADQSPGAFEKVVDRLLKSPRYGERMAWQWLEAARFADTDGYQNDGPRDMWRWRDWVIEAYNRNQTFDQFTIEQLAGDLLPNPTLDQRIATGFNRNHRYNSEAGLVLEEFLLENAVDRVDTTSTVWMGLTMGCARCHDHKFDPLSQKEYYQLIAFFDGVPESGRAIKFGNSEPWIKAPTDAQAMELAELDAAVEQARQALTSAESEIAKAQAAWEPRAKTDQQLLTNGLTLLPEPAKVENLICNGRFTIAFRMTPEQVDAGAVLSNETADTTRKGILVEFNDAKLRFHIISRWIAGVATLETERDFNPGESVHVMLTNDGAQRASGMRIFVDGEAVATRELHNTNSNKSGKAFGGVMRVGESKHAGNWSGTVDDLRFYTRDTLGEREARILATRESVEAIAELAPDKRSKPQSEKLRRYFLEHAAAEPHQLLLTDLLAAEANRRKYFDSLPTTMVMLEMVPPQQTRIRERGVYHARGEEVQPGLPAVFPGMPNDFSANRLGFARWLVSGEHPLTARVAVNRYWQLLFGQGLVKTSEDFGAQGDPPSHPELLDWLAIEFVESGWNVQHLLKTIILSQTYRQSSHVTPELLAADPDNRLYARAPRLRLAGNHLRDQALFVSGLLVEKRGGPSVKPYQPAKLWSEASNFRYTAGKGEDLYRRSLYTYWKRTLAPPSMAVLDTADREWCSVKPRQTNTPLQALTLLNETGFFEAARNLGQRILTEGGETDAERTAFAFRLVTARVPSAVEQQLLVSAYAAYRQDFSENAKGAKETQTVGNSDPGDSDPLELAATTALANVLLNLDEVTARK